MALTLNSSYQNVGFDYVLDGVRDLLISEFTYGKIYISPELKFNEPFQIKLWVSESATEDYNAISWSKEYTVDIDLYMIDSNHDENAYKQLYQDTERIYQVLFNNAHKEITVAGNSLQWLNGKTETIGINDFDGEEGEVDGLLKSSLSFTCNVHAGEISNYSTRSLDFDGSDDYVNFGDVSDIDSLSAITISSWIKCSSTGGTNPIFSKYKDDNESIQLLVNGNKILFQVENSNDCSADFAYTSNDWNHIVAVFNGSGSSNADKCKIYLNGVSQTLTFTGTFPSSVDDLSGYDTYIGRRSTGYYIGNIDEVAIWNTALTQSAITELYNSGKPKDIRIGNFRHLFDSSCVAYWRMGDGTLDEYPLIADQTNATLGSNLSVWSGETVSVGAYSGIENDTTVNLTSGKLYKISFTVSSYTSGSFRFRQPSGADAGVTGSGNGDYTQYIFATNVNELNCDAFNLGFVGVISDYIVKEVNGNAGLMTNMASGDIEEDTP